MARIGLSRGDFRKKMNVPDKNMGSRFQGLSIFQWVLALVLGAVFVFASWHKITNPAEFSKIIYGYGLFPKNSINMLAIWVPFVELVCGICLIFGIWKRPALLLLNVLLLTFILIIAINLIRGHEFDCGCFSFAHHSTRQAAITLLIRDIALFLAGLYLYICLLKKSSNHS